MIKIISLCMELMVVLGYHRYQHLGLA